MCLEAESVETRNRAVGPGDTHPRGPVSGPTVDWLRGARMPLG